MRIPYEGMLAALALGDSNIPLLVSVWGNDFTLHAASTARMASLTRLALDRATALHADCRRDIRLARSWSYPADRPTTVLPGNGGVRKGIFYAEDRSEREPAAAKAPLVIQPRGFRAYVRNDTFFRSIPLVLEKRPEVRFLCPAMQGEERAERWLRALGVAGSVDLLPHQTPQEMAMLFRQAQVAVSPTTHDGTPNTLLEALACGCFPLAGDLEPLREWITPGVNGLLFEPGEPASLAGAVLLALEQPDLRRQAWALNLALIARRAEHELVMRQAEDFYTSIMNLPFL
jgi:glycosyltransferase involved in cell wall biosynthesis